MACEHGKGAPRGVGKGKCSDCGHHLKAHDANGKCAGCAKGLKEAAGSCSCKGGPLARGKCRDCGHEASEHSEKGECKACAKEVKESAREVLAEGLRGHAFGLGLLKGKAFNARVLRDRRGKIADVIDGPNKHQGGEHGIVRKLGDVSAKISTPAHESSKPGGWINPGTRADLASDPELNLFRNTGGKRSLTDKLGDISARISAPAHERGINPMAAAELANDPGLMLFSNKRTFKLGNPAAERAAEAKRKAMAGPHFEYHPTGMDAWGDGPKGLKAGQRVVKVQPPGTPKNGTMGQTYVADASTGEFIGMVNTKSLKRVPKGKADPGSGPNATGTRTAFNNDLAWADSSALSQIASISLPDKGESLTTPDGIKITHSAAVVKNSHDPNARDPHETYAIEFPHGYNKFSPGPLSTSAHGEDDARAAIDSWRATQAGRDALTNVFHVGERGQAEKGKGDPGTGGKGILTPGNSTTGDRTLAAEKHGWGVNRKDDPASWREPFPEPGGTRDSSPGEARGTAGVTFWAAAYSPDEFRQHLKDQSGYDGPLEVGTVSGVHGDNEIVVMYPDGTPVLDPEGNPARPLTADQADGITGGMPDDIPADEWKDGADQPDVDLTKQKLTAAELDDKLTRIDDHVPFFVKRSNGTTAAITRYQQSYLDGGGSGWRVQDDRDTLGYYDVEDFSDFENAKKAVLGGDRAGTIHSGQDRLFMRNNGGNASPGDKAAMDRFDRALKGKVSVADTEATRNASAALSGMSERERQKLTVTNISTYPHGSYTGGPFHKGDVMFGGRKIGTVEGTPAEFNRKVRQMEADGMSVADSEATVDAKGALANWDRTGERTPFLNLKARAMAHTGDAKTMMTGDTLLDVDKISKLKPDGNGTPSRLGGGGTTIFRRKDGYEINYDPNFYDPGDPANLPNEGMVQLPAGTPATTVAIVASDPALYDVWKKGKGVTLDDLYALRVKQNDGGPGDDIGF